MGIRKTQHGPAVPRDISARLPQATVLFVPRMIHFPSYCCCVWPMPKEDRERDAGKVLESPLLPSYLASIAPPCPVVSVPEIALGDSSYHGDQDRCVLCGLCTFVYHGHYIVGASPILQALRCQHPCVLLILEQRRSMDCTSNGTKYLQIHKDLFITIILQMRIQIKYQKCLQ